MNRATGALVAVAGAVGVVFFDNAFIEIVALGAAAIGGYEAVGPADPDDLPAVY